MAEYDIIFSDQNPDTDTIIETFANCYVGDPRPKVLPFMVRDSESKEFTIEIPIVGLTYESGSSGMFLINYGLESTQGAGTFYNSESRTGSARNV